MKNVIVSIVLMLICLIGYSQTVTSEAKGVQSVYKTLLIGNVRSYGYQISAQAGFSGSEAPSDVNINATVTSQNFASYGLRVSATYTSYGSKSSDYLNGTQSMIGHSGDIIYLNAQSNVNFGWAYARATIWQ